MGKLQMGRFKGYSLSIASGVKPESGIYTTFIAVIIFTGQIANYRD